MGGGVGNRGGTTIQSGLAGEVGDTGDERLIGDSGGDKE